MTKATENAMTEVRKGSDPWHCCWHCRHYVRPIPVVGMLDGPATEICTVDRHGPSYRPSDQWQDGDKPVLPDDYCDRFEIDPLPTSLEQSTQRRYIRSRLSRSQLPT